MMVTIITPEETIENVDLNGLTLFGNSRKNDPVKEYKHYILYSDNLPDMELIEKEIAGLDITEDDRRYLYDLWRVKINSF